VDPLFSQGVAVRHPRRFGALLVGASLTLMALTAAPTAWAWSEANVGVPYDQFVTELNTDANPFTALIDTEGPLGTGIQNLLELTGIQQDLLDPVLGLVGSLGGLLTS
jgi:hypothetical protein